MDPNATLSEIREILRTVGGDLQRLADLVDSLDGWLSSGGFLPEAWNEASDVTY